MMMVKTGFQAQGGRSQGRAGSAQRESEGKSLGTGDAVKRRQCNFLQDESKIVKGDLFLFK